MGCQTKIAKTIIDKVTDYLLALKGKQETLFAALKYA
jgi:predicted transposase YbfD/YdcC